MKACYPGDVPGYIEIDDDGYKITMTLDDAKELRTTLEDAIQKAEDAMPELLPCPFCGSRAEIPPSARARIWCTECGAEMCANSWEIAIRMWNRRMTDDQ